MGSCQLALAASLGDVISGTINRHDAAELFLLCVDKCNFFSLNVLLIEMTHLT